MGEKLSDEISLRLIDNKVLFKNKVESILSRETFVKKADIHLPITNDIISSMYRPFVVDFISCNGSYLAGHSIDFNSSVDIIEKKINEFRILSEGLKALAIKKRLDGEGEYIVYFNEPESNSQKKIFDAAKTDSSKPFKMKEVESMKEIEAQLNKGYKKFTEVL